MLMRKLPMRVALMAIVGALSLALVPAALAAKGGGGGNTGGSTSTSSVRLVPLNSTDGLPHYGQQVTFDVSTTVTTRPYVTLTCVQNGTPVYSNQVGYYPGYPWVQSFTLASSYWTGGAASCTARLEYWNGKRWTPVTSMSFAVSA